MQRQKTCCAHTDRREKTNTFKAQLNVVTHEMCRKREKRERERPITCSIFSHLNRSIHTIEGKQTNEEILERAKLITSHYWRSAFKTSKDAELQALSEAIKTPRTTKTQSETL